MPNWRRECDLLFIAIAFLTRIPIPAGTAHTQENLNAASRYFPAVGLLVGAIAAAIFACSNSLWTIGIAIILAMAATVRITGAFHEDGFADSCDGFGGGWTRDQVLTIMKDSRIGTYGAVGLGLLLAIKFLALQALGEPWKIACAFLVGHTWSRLLAISYLLNFSYVRDGESSKVKPLATAMSRNDFFIAGLIALPLVLTISPLQTGAIVLTLALWRWWFGRYMLRRIDGYTGDCLGAAQQVAEVLIYLILAVPLLNG
ncbi:MAG: cobalamin 5-phosphate synthase/cobalamin synthase [Verrucomicrobiaceae bacterium]|nr:cobalamin 5-phosphate synthase/cobalamin synthase [Verrucomicrobiaceae bacterium]